MTLQIIQDEVKACVKCKLHSTRTNTVFSRGNPNSLICIIGEAPGQDEDLQGLPFVGKSGQLLDQSLMNLGLDPNKDVYICNIVKCRPPYNRKPEIDETWTCFSYLERQLELIKAKTIVTLGNIPMSILLKLPDGITKIRGNIFKYKSYNVIPTFHPSYILRNGGTHSEMWKLFLSDLKLAIDNKDKVNS